MKPSHHLGSMYAFLAPPPMLTTFRPFARVNACSFAKCIHRQKDSRVPRLFEKSREFSSVEFRRYVTISEAGAAEKTIRDTIKDMSKVALKSRDTKTRERLSSILGKFVEEEKSKNFKGWSLELEQQVVAKYVKNLQQSLNELAGTPLADAYKEELDLLAPFQPKVLSEEETRALVEPLVKEAKSIGQFMGVVMKSLKSKGVDPGLARKIGEELGLK
mmetsp:Transcript_34271/g.55463  ORF Transcript_34271/g.55463 Transcript_34271/m.55463 type:complete len:217 (+) Transcript_34271:320-970(+)